MATAPLQMLVGSTIKLRLEDVELPADTPLLALSGPGTFELTAIINDGQGEVDPAGVVYPLDFALDLSRAGSVSDWSVVIPAALAIVAEQSYFAIVDLNDGAFRLGRWKIPLIAKDRDALDIL